MNTGECILTIGAVVLGTLLTRFLPFLVFRKEPPRFITDLGKVLPSAAVGLLVVYCLKDAPFAASHGLPELIAIALITILHKWKHNTLLSIAGGTAAYMLLVQYLFV